jgi:putative component of membrane protein insertase Oxa1/YidC/SpoIIIJ protein YidD
MDESTIKVNTTTVIALHHKNFFSRYNPVSLSLRGSMLFYQNIVSPQFQGSCLYERSCSNFSKEAIHHFGIIKGVFLSADRLMRCNHPVETEISFLDERENGKYSDEPEKYFFLK